MIILLPVFSCSGEEGQAERRRRSRRLGGNGAGKKQNIRHRFSLTTVLFPCFFMHQRRNSLPAEISYTSLPISVVRSPDLCADAVRLPVPACDPLRRGGGARGQDESGGDGQGGGGRLRTRRRRGMRRKVRGDFVSQIYQCPHSSPEQNRCREGQ